MVAIITRHKYHHIGLDTTHLLPRNATQNAHAPDALTQTASPNASTRSLTLRPVPQTISGSYSGTSLIRQVRDTSPHQNSGPLRKEFQIYLPKCLLRPSVNWRPKLFRPRERLFLPSVAIVHHPVRPLSHGHTYSTKRRDTILPALYFRHSPSYCLSHPPGLHPCPISRHCPREPNGFSFLLQPWGS